MGPDKNVESNPGTRMQTLSLTRADAVEIFNCSISNGLIYYEYEFGSSLYTKMLLKQIPVQNISLTSLNAHMKVSHATLKHINSIQNWFGMAICQNSADDIWRLEWYCITFKDKNDDYPHRIGPPHQLTWCKYQKDKLTGKTTQNIQYYKSHYLNFCLVTIYG